MSWGTALTIKSRAGHLRQKKTEEKMLKLKRAAAKAAAMVKAADEAERLAAELQSKGFGPTSSAAAAGKGASKSNGKGKDKGIGKGKDGKQGKGGDKKTGVAGRGGEKQDDDNKHDDDDEDEESAAKLELLNEDIFKQIDLTLVFR